MLSTCLGTSFRSTLRSLYCAQDLLPGLLLPDQSATFRNCVATGAGQAGTAATSTPTSVLNTSFYQLLPLRGFASHKGGRPPYRRQAPYRGDGDEEEEHDDYLRGLEEEQSEGEDDPEDEAIELEFDKWEQLMEEDDIVGAARQFESVFTRIEDPYEGLSDDEEADGKRADLEGEGVQKRQRMVDQFGQAVAFGRRKSSTARVYLREGEGQITVNNMPMDAYFAIIQRRDDVLEPFRMTDTMGEFDVWATVRGGGTTGQAHAVRHAIANALQRYEPAFRFALKPEGLLTFDSRRVERKKPGKAKARKSFQWVKR